MRGLDGIALHLSLFYPRNGVKYKKGVFLFSLELGIKGREEETAGRTGGKTLGRTRHPLGLTLRRLSVLVGLLPVTNCKWMPTGSLLYFVYWFLRPDQKLGVIQLSKVLNVLFCVWRKALSSLEKEPGSRRAGRTGPRRPCPRPELGESHIEAGRTSYSCFSDSYTWEAFLSPESCDYFYKIVGPKAKSLPAETPSALSFSYRSGGGRMETEGLVYLFSGGGVSLWMKAMAFPWGRHFSSR